jgi:glutamate---cysteine ligase / carboxylate-amine ligase
MESETRSPRSAAARGARRAGENAYCFGIEEEYFLADAATLEVVRETPDQLFSELTEKTHGRTFRESLQAQMEVSTPPYTSAGDARECLAHLRRTAVETAGDYGLAVLACGTFPAAEWDVVEPAKSGRYSEVMDALQMVGRRNLLCGMHVHVEVPDPERRVDVMTRMIPYIPLLAALSVSSPFWRSKLTGLHSYRLAAYDELPRSGLPELFGDDKNYERYVSALMRAGIIKDPTYIWWALRPSHKYPTLELRAPDSCTRLEDALAVACLFRALVRHLFRNPAKNAGLDAALRSIAIENKWQAQRLGIHAVFAAEEGPSTVPQLLDRVLTMIADDAAALDCSREVDHCRTIAGGGSSSDAQLRIFDEKRAEGSAAGLKAAAHWVVQTTGAC